MQHKPIIGLSGTNGSGKDTVGLLLSQQFGFLFISVSDLIRAELVRRGQSTERANTRALSSEWRQKFGLSVLVDRAVEAFAPVADKYAGLVISSLRNPYEPKRVHELGGTVLWIDADPKTRYQRLTDIKRDGRGVDDNKSFEQFLADEAIEMRPPQDGDDTSLNMSAVREQCDLLIKNDGLTISQLADLLQDKLELRHVLKGNNIL